MHHISCCSAMPVIGSGCGPWTRCDAAQRVCRRPNLQAVWSLVTLCSPGLCCLVSTPAPALPLPRQGVWSPKEQAAAGSAGRQVPGDAVGCLTEHSREGRNYNLQWDRWDIYMYVYIYSPQPGIS